jgi:uncharacterized protein YndB with AHSA1/START domain
MALRRLLYFLLVVIAVVGVAVLPLPFLDRTRIAGAIDIARPPGAVFDYVTTPGNWPKWHPASKAVHGTTDHSLAVGEQVTEDFIVAGRAGQVVWTAVKRDPPRQWIIEGDVRGRNAGVVTYTLSPSAEGTRFDREFVYPSPNILFSLLNRLSIRSQVESESAQALANLKRILETPP